MSYEELILERQENTETDECRNCPYKGVETCRNQCMEEKTVYNPNLPRA